MSSMPAAELELARYTQHGSAGELESFQNRPADEANASSSLPPTDGGKDAWLFLFACFMMEALVWGAWTRCSTAHLTAARVRRILRCFPRVLRHARVRRLGQHCCSGYLCHGKILPWPPYLLT